MHRLMKCTSVFIAGKFVRFSLSTLYVILALPMSLSPFLFGYLERSAVPQTAATYRKITTQNTRAPRTLKGTLRLGTNFAER